jgi:hypothetical protein
MAKIIEKGSDFMIDLGGGRVGCANTVEWSAETEMTDAACREVGPFRSAVPGMKSADITVSGIKIRDTPVVTSAVRAHNFAEAYMNNTLLPFVIGDASDEAYVWYGDAYVRSYSESGEQSGNGTYNAALQVEGEFFYALRSAVPVTP